MPSGSPRGGIRSRKGNDLKKLLCICAAVLALACAAFLLYAADGYRADATALAALLGSPEAAVVRTDWGWRFDGPSEDTVLVFYPGAKVDAEAYAPLLLLLAEKDVDVCLVRMPLRFAFLGADKAAGILRGEPYTRRFVGGHSLGGAMAARFAAREGSGVDGVVLLAAYPTEKLPDGTKELLIYGSEDRVVNRDRIREGERFAPEDYSFVVIGGGNHAQFGNYGPQKGDGTASITAETQQRETADAIAAALTGRPDGL